jgi:hypothetical protein
LDINSYLWSANLANILATVSSLPSSNLQSSNKNQAQSINFFSNQSNNSKYKNLSGISLFNNQRQQAHNTPSVQKLCKILDEDLRKILNDIEFSTTSNMNNDAQKTNSYLFTSVLNEDLKKFNEYLQDCLQLFGQNLCDSFLDFIQKLKTNEFKQSRRNRLLSESNSNSPLNSLDSNLNMKQILLICRFAHSIPSNCPHFKLCYNNLKLSTQDSLVSSLLRKSGAAALTETKVLSEENWLKQINQLREIIRTGFEYVFKQFHKEILLKF